MAKICRKCGMQVSDSVTVCPKCHTPFNTSAGMSGNRNGGQSSGQQRNEASNARRQAPNGGQRGGGSYGASYEGGRSENHQRSHQGNMYQNYNPQPNYNQSFGDSSQYEELIVDPSEHIVASLENNDVTSFLGGGGLTKTKLFFTNRRLYAKTRHLGWNLSRQNSVVNIEDITETHIEHRIYYLKIVAAVLSVVLAIICFFLSVVNLAIAAFGLIFIISAIVDVVSFFFKRGLIFVFSYAGGKTLVYLNGYPHDSVMQFHKQFRLYLSKNFNK